MLSELERFAEAYLDMAAVAKYRPAAPSDGLGSVFLTDEQLKDRKLLVSEAIEYAQRFQAETNGLLFRIGVPDFSTNKALVYLVEAARLACSGNGRERARILASMAAEELAKPAR